MGFSACFVRPSSTGFAGARRMSVRDEDRFRPRPGAPKARHPRFVSRVLQVASKAGGKALKRTAARTGARLGRGQVAARFAGKSLGARSRRVIIKTRLVVLKQAGPRSTKTHLRYVARDGVGRDGEDGRAYGPATDQADLADFEARGREDRHQFRFIVAPEDAEQLGDLRSYTRHLMTRVEADLGTRLDWVAVDHWDTDNPHTHIVLRGKSENGRDLVIARDYIAHGMRQRASELATEWLGPRTELEIRESLSREVGQQRWTGLDRALQREVRNGLIRMDAPLADAQARQQRTLLLGRLQRLAGMGLASERSASVWVLRADAEPVLRAMGERGDIVRTMRRALGGVQRELTVFNPTAGSRAVIGRVAGKGLADELHDRGYLVVDGIDGRAHYVVLGAGADLIQFPVGVIVQARGAAEIRAADKTIVALAKDGLYRAAHHLADARAHASNADPQALVAAHVRRLEALRRTGIVERVSEGVWKIPSDLPECGRRYDAARLRDNAVELHSHLPIERQTRVVGATWLDRQLLGPIEGLSDAGFGGEVRAALQRRAEFLIGEGLAERRGQRTVFARNLLATLCSREIESASRAIAAETGLAHHAVAEGERVTGVYRRTVLLASGRFAMLDDGMGFSLVPWRPVIGQPLGQTLTAVLKGGGVTWEIGRHHSPSIS